MWLCKILHKYLCKIGAEDLDLLVQEKAEENGGKHD